MDFPNPPVRRRHRARLFLPIGFLAAGLGIYAGISFFGPAAEANQKTAVTATAADTATHAGGPTALFGGTSLTPSADFKVGGYLSSEDATSIYLRNSTGEIKLIFGTDRACKAGAAGCDYKFVPSEFKKNDESGFTVSVPEGSIQVNGVKSAGEASSLLQTLQPVAPDVFAAALKTVQ